MKHIKDTNLFIHLNNQKQPWHKLDQSFSWAEANIWPDGAGILIKEPYIVLDFDSHWMFKKMLTVLNAFNIKTPIMATDKGGHVWFKTPTQFKKQTKIKLPILLKCDVLCWGRSMTRDKSLFAMIKRNGTWRKWLYETTDVADLPYWLYPPTNGKYSNLDLEHDFQENESRNSDFTKLVWAFTKQGQFSEEQIQVIIEIINDYLIEVPLGAKEIKVLTRSAVDSMEAKKDPTHDDFYDTAGHVIHQNIGNALINEFKLKIYNHEFYIYDFKIQKYIRGQFIIENTLNKWIYNITSHQVSEVLRYLRREVPDIYNKDAPYEYIGFKNGLFNVKTYELIPPTWDIFTPYYLDVYAPKDETDLDLETQIWVYELLIDILGTQKQYELLMQYIGYTLLPINMAQKALFLYGTGANGKSLILENLIKPLFMPYYVALPLKQLGERFNMAGLDGNLINIANENSGTFIKYTETFKAVTSGDSQQLERKGQDSYYGAITAKLYYAFNSLPRFEDTSKGLTRRILLLHFNKVYEGSNNDPTLKFKIHNNWDKIASVLMYEAIDGLKTLAKNNWIFPETNAELYLEVQALSNPIISWIQDQDLPEEYFIEEIENYNGKYEPRPATFYVNECNLWCAENGYKSKYTPTGFTAKLKEIFPNIETKQIMLYNLAHKKIERTRVYTLKEKLNAGK